MDVWSALHLAEAPDPNGAVLDTPVFMDGPNLATRSLRVRRSRLAPCAISVSHGRLHGGRTTHALPSSLRILSTLRSPICGRAALATPTSIFNSEPESLMRAQPSAAASRGSRLKSASDALRDFDVAFPLLWAGIFFLLGLAQHLLWYPIGDLDLET